MVQFECHRVMQSFVSFTFDVNTETVEREILRVGRKVPRWGKILLNALHLVHFQIHLFTCSLKVSQFTSNIV